jgi:hypothetical protein
MPPYKEKEQLRQALFIMDALKMMYKENVGIRMGDNITSNLVLQRITDQDDMSQIDSYHIAIGKVFEKKLKAICKSGDDDEWYIRLPKLSKRK